MLSFYIYAFALFLGVGSIVWFSLDDLKRYFILNEGKIYLFVSFLAFVCILILLHWLNFINLII